MESKEEFDELERRIEFNTRWLAAYVLGSQKGIRTSPEASSVVCPPAVLLQA